MLIAVGNNSLIPMLDQMSRSIASRTLTRSIQFESARATRSDEVSAQIDHSSCIRFKIEEEMAKLWGRGRSPDLILKAVQRS